MDRQRNHDDLSVVGRRRLRQTARFWHLHRKRRHTFKNWAIAYPDGQNARLAPVYDYVCTRAYYPNGQLALTLGGERDFERIGREVLGAFAKAAEISARRTVVIANEVVAAIRDKWPAV